MSKSRDLGEFPAAALDIDASGNLDVTGTVTADGLVVSGNSYVGSGNTFTDATSGYFFAGNGQYTNGIYGVGVNNVAIAASGSERMRIDNAGRITTPYQPHWHGGLGISGATNGLANISSTRSTRGGLSWSGDRITATVSGVYAISLNTLTQIDSVRRDVYILLNGVAIIQTLNDVANGHHYRSASLTLIMQEGDYIQVSNDLWYDPGTTVTTWKSFSMSLIG